MTIASEIKKAMAQETGQNEDDFDYITQELIDNHAEQSKPLEPTDGHPTISRIWTGNNLIVNGRNWSWEDTPGSQCGRTRKWRYVAQTGATYRQGGRCPQGYVWYEMNIP